MTASSQFCFGIEQEHPPISILNDGTPRPTNNIEAYYGLRDAIKKSGIPHLFDRRGMFIPYGRFYLEGVGNHVETAVIPCENPDHAVKNEAKFTRVLQDAIISTRAQFPGLNLLRNNIDYITGSTWASHESYAIDRPPEYLKNALLPFLITRQVFSGSATIMGGGMRLSPRALFMNVSSGGGTTHKRAIYSLSRDEPLMDGSAFTHRLHLILGDGLMSQFGQWLKLGTTALVIRLAENNPDIGEAVKFHQPVSAIKSLSVLTPQKASLFNAKLLRVQKHYLYAVSRMLEKGFLPEWCEDVVQAWSEVLSTLEQDPMALCDRLDPYIKLRLYDEYLRSQKLTWSDVTSFSNIYFQLAMLDVRYHALVDGVFEELDSSGALNHRRYDDEEVRPGSEAEPFIPESLPREVLRARIIKSHSGREGYSCRWTEIVDENIRRMITMNDPFSSDCCWTHYDSRNPFDDEFIRFRDLYLE